MTPKQQAYRKLATTLIEKFDLRNMKGFYCATKEEALTKAISFLTPNCSISWGGSITLEEIGLLHTLKQSEYTLYDRITAKTPKEQKELYGKIVTSDFFFMSSNAITLDGQLVNIDGRGNRVSCLIAGPEQIIVIAGMNKIVTDVNTAIERIRNMASPANAIRLNLDTPCKELGKCTNCLCEHCICCQTVITRNSKIPDRIKIILVGEELGY